MDAISVSGGCYDSLTLVSTIFIDEYMPMANDAQLKVYLHLLRCIQSNAPFSIGDMADRFNYTEKDIRRALEYWNRQGLIDVSCNFEGEITHLRINSPAGRTQSAINWNNGRESGISGLGVSGSNISGSGIAGSGVYSQPAVGLNQSATTGGQSMPGTQENERVSRLQVVYKPSPVSLDNSSSVHSTSIKEIIFLAETYLQKILTSTDLNSLIYIHEKLGFDQELIDYLLQYCVELGKTSFKYIQKVAVNWHEEGITSVSDARSRACVYPKLVYDVLNALGIKTAPTRIEADLILKWEKTYGFGRDVIDEAVKRTVYYSSGGRMKYADTILTAWHTAGYKTLEEILKADEDKPSGGSKSGSGNNGNGGNGSFGGNGNYGGSNTRSGNSSKKPGNFSSFPSQNYDISDIEKRLVGSV